MSNYTYRYNFYLNYINNGKLTEIPTESVSMCFIQYNYTSKTNFTPILVLQLKLDNLIYADMQKNRISGRVIMRVTKSRSGTNMEEDYIYREMRYKFSTDEQDLELNKNKTNSSAVKEESYKNVALGLTDINALEANRISTNKVFKNTNMETMVHSFMNFKLIKEPFSNNKRFDQFLVPPLSEVPKMLAYMNSYSSFYNTSYIYFYDFNYAYLLSTRGKAQTIIDGSYDTVNITITSQTNNEEDSNMQGMVIDTKNRMYKIQVNSNEFTPIINGTTDSIFNVLRSIDSLGNTKSRKLDVNHDKSTTDKIRYIRVPDEDSGILESTANDIESTRMSVSINKTGIDSSIMIPCRAYYIIFPEQYEQFTGNYFLDQKIETYVPNSDGFQCSGAYIFKKV